MYTYIYIYIYIYMYVHMYIHLYICIQIQGGANNKIRVNRVVVDVLQERKMRAAYVLSQVLSIYMYVCIYLSTHVHTHMLQECKKLAFSPPNKYGGASMLHHKLNHLLGVPPSSNAKQI